MTVTGPLDGIRVIEVGTLISGPFAGRLLGDMGAEVDQDRTAGRAGPAAHLGPGRTRRPPLLLDGARPQQEGRHSQPAGARGSRAVPRPGRALRRHRRELPAGHAGEVEPRLRRTARTQSRHHPGAGIGVRADRTGSTQGRLRLGRRGGQRPAAHERISRRSAATAGAVARRQPRGDVRRTGRDGRAVPPHGHRRGPGRRRRADRILSGGAGIHDSRLRRRRRGARPVGHPAGGHRAVEHLSDRRRQLGGDRRQPGHRLPQAVRGDGTAGTRHRRPVRQSRCART